MSSRPPGTYESPMGTVFTVYEDGSIEIHKESVPTRFSVNQSNSYPTKFDGNAAENHRYTGNYIDNGGFGHRCYELAPMPFKEFQSTQGCGNMKIDRTNYDLYCRNYVPATFVPPITLTEEERQQYSEDNARGGSVQGYIGSDNHVYNCYGDDCGPIGKFVG